MRQASILRVVVASPGDVMNEREMVQKVAEELNRGIAADRGLRLEVTRWETDAYPGFHVDGPQGLIDPILRIEDCDVLIGIFWMRFGTPTASAKSGTAHEIQIAYESWQQKRRPQIMVYFNQKPYRLESDMEVDQWRKVLEFKQNFPREGVWWPYHRKTDFERLIREHLTQFLLQYERLPPEPSTKTETRNIPTSDAPGKPPGTRLVFRTGGALPSDYPHYVTRRADREADREMGLGRPISLIAPRQTGKTSLLKRLAAQLQDQGWVCCSVDLAALMGLERPRWYQAIGSRIARECSLREGVSLPHDQEDLRTFLLDEVGLNRADKPARIALFLDEVEGLLNSEFSDSFWMMIRDLYQTRSDYAGQFRMALAGAVDPSKLVNDDRISPFNIAVPINMEDFTPEESLVLTSNLSHAGGQVSEEVHDRIYWWVSGHPHLTQRICEILERETITEAVTRISTTEVDKVVLERLLSLRSGDSNVKQVRNKIANLAPYSAKLWKRLLAGEPVRSSEPGYYGLYLTGAVAESSDGTVTIRNRVYEQVLRGAITS